MTIKISRQGDQTAAIGVTNSTSTADIFSLDDNAGAMVLFGSGVSSNLSTITPYVGAAGAAAGDLVPLYDAAGAPDAIATTTGGTFSGAGDEGTGVPLPDGVFAAGSVQLIGNHATTAAVTIMTKG